MKETNLLKLSLEELKKREKTTKTSTVLLLGMIIVQIAVGVFLTFKQKFSVFTILPIAFFPILVVNNTNLKKIRTEINSREM